MNELPNYITCGEFMNGREKAVGLRCELCNTDSVFYEYERFGSGFFVQKHSNCITKAQKEMRRLKKQLAKYDREIPQLT